MERAVTTANFSGSRCGRQFVRELETQFKDCLVFYIDSRICFERYCFGEGACLVFRVWAKGFSPAGEILWQKEPSLEAHRAVLPRVLTQVQEDGQALQFDGAARRFRFDKEYQSDPDNGYTPFKLFLLKMRGYPKREG